MLSIMKELVLPELKASPLSREINNFIRETEGKYKPYQPEYYMRHALRSAREAFERGNYGIGASILVVDEKGAARYSGRNHMFTGNQFDRTHMHAETDSIKAMLSTRKKPDEEFTLKEVGSLLHTVFGKNAKRGIIVFGTLEPCQKCATEITHLLQLAQERLGPDSKVASISANVDGVVKFEGKGKNKVAKSSSAANVLGAKSLTAPDLWGQIQNGFSEDNNDPPVRFSLLHYDKNLLEPGVLGYVPKPWEFTQTDEKKLVNLCSEVFTRGRIELDRALGGKKSA